MVECVVVSADWHRMSSRTAVFLGRESGTCQREPPSVESTDHRWPRLKVKVRPLCRDVCDRWMIRLGRFLCGRFRFSSSNGVGSAASTFWRWRRYRPMQGTQVNTDVASSESAHVFSSHRSIGTQRHRPQVLGGRRRDVIIGSPSDAARLYCSLKATRSIRN